MPTLTQSTQSLIDQYKNVDGKGQYIDVIETLNNTAQYCLDDWVWMECNSGLKHTRAIRTGLPTVAWTALYEGIPQSKSAKQTVDDTTGMVEGLSSVDQRQLDLYADNKVAIRSAEARTFVEAISQELMTALFYHNSNANVRLPKGLGARYGVKATFGAGNQIIDAGGTGSDNTSIWMVEWGYDGLTAIYPKGTVGGVQRENMGRQRVTDASGNPYYVEEEKIGCNVGFSVGDWQRIVRVANIDVSDMLAGSVNLYDLLQTAWYRSKTRRIAKLHDQKAPGRSVLYCNKDVLMMLDKLAYRSSNANGQVYLRPMEIEGKEVLTFRGVPIRETDSLVNTEARVV
jgi:hypothetical protein